MKRFLAGMLVMMLLSGCAGHQILLSQEMQVQRVIDMTDTPKNTLFDKSRMWFASAFAKANSVIQYENKENGTIMGNGVATISSDRLKFAISTEVKDNKARITMNGQSMSNAYDFDLPVQRRYWNYYFENELNNIADHYEAYLKGTAPEVKSDKW